MPASADTFSTRAGRRIGWLTLAIGLTAAAITAAGLPCKTVFKVNEGRPNVVDLIKSDEIDLIVNTPLNPAGAVLDATALTVTFAGGDAPTELAKHVARVCHVHCKDVRSDVLATARAQRRSFLDAVVDGVFTVPGDGSLAGTERRMPFPPKGVVQRRLTFTADRPFPGIQGPRHWLRSSPDGRRIAFLMKDEDGLVQLWTVSPNGGAPAQVTRNPWPAPPGRADST